ncbi:TRAPP trafficking subunit Trs65-domain-containing protein [Coniella lustricola]|uniref:TRAPP trafficking subunit Trs65-domain-containing protein n=1 Tax=Coniella lustricola TaxID=2025994 RepID=A0A2T3AIZ7_9PEZI|nr:TRAPP trafficking subunit Trs65-domain-containing protein [Coniella lustricola]
MAVPSQLEDAAADAGDSAFLGQSYLTYIIPFSTTVDIKAEVENAIASNRPLADINSRPWLLFDETIDIFLILKTHGLTDDKLQYYSNRLLLSIQAQVFNTPSPERADATRASEVIYNGELEDVRNPIATIHGAGDVAEAGSTKYTIWKASVFLGRPRLRLFGPSIVFTAVASLRPDPAHFGEQQDGYLESGVPAGLNLLESFARDPWLGGVKPRLSAVRVSRVAPATQITKDSFPMLRGLQNLSKKIYPAVHTRVRFSRPNSLPPSLAIIALLEIDFTPYFDCIVTVDKIELNIPDGQVEDLNDCTGLELPLQCVAHDHLTLMYRLTPKGSDVPSKSPNRELFILIECTALVTPENCKPSFRMAWSTILDFTLPVNPGFGSGVTKPFQRSHRPTQLSIGDGASFVLPSVARPDSIPSLEAATDRSLGTDIGIPDFGITMTFTSQSGPIYPGDEFVWTIFVVNRISTTAIPVGPNTLPTPLPRKLALVAIPKRRRNDMRVMRPPSTAGARRKSVAAVAHGNTHHGHGQYIDADNASLEVADAVLDENIVHAMQHSSLVDSTDVVCLSADLRVGPLAPNACHVVEMRFLALKEGIVEIECVRVVDLGNQEHVDIRELPVTVVDRRPG